MKNEKNVIDKNGTKYEKHVISHFGLVTGEAYYRISDEDADRTLIITLAGGIFGLHHFLRGDFYRGLLYMITGGGFGILYISDVLKQILGTYYFYESKYENDEYGRLIRQKEKVYVGEITERKMKLISVPVSIITAITVVFLLYMPIYQSINTTVSDMTSSTIQSVIEAEHK